MPSVFNVYRFIHIICIQLNYSKRLSIDVLNQYNGVYDKLSHSFTQSSFFFSQTRGTGELRSLAKEVLLCVQDECKFYNGGPGPLHLPRVCA